MDMDQEDQSGKTQWTKYYLTVYFSGLFNFLMILILSVLFGTLSETFIVYVVLIFYGLSQVAGMQNQMALSSRKHGYLCRHTICIEKFFCELTVYL